MIPPKQVCEPDSSEWSSGPFDCSQDCNSFALALFCPCILYGRNVNIMKKKGVCRPACVYCCCRFTLFKSCALGTITRIRIRARYGIVGDSTGDCLMHCCCSPCALSQEYREITKREGENVQNAN